MVKLLCIIEVHNTDDEQWAKSRLDDLRQSLTNNDIAGFTIYQATPEDLTLVALPARVALKDAPQQGRPPYGVGRCTICGNAWPCELHNP